jgi:hypothetical protein
MPAVRRPGVWGRNKRPPQVLERGWLDYTTGAIRARARRRRTTAATFGDRPDRRIARARIVLGRLGVLLEMLIWDPPLRVFLSASYWRVDDGSYVDGGDATRAEALATAATARQHRKLEIEATG